MAMKPRKMIARNAGKKTEEMGTRTRGGNMSKKAEEEMGPRGSGAVKKMRKPGANGAPTAKAFKESAKTAKRGRKK